MRYRDTCCLSTANFRCNLYSFLLTINPAPSERGTSFSGFLILMCSAWKLPSIIKCNRPRASAALVSGATGQYDETFTLSPTHSCMISFGAASCTLMTSSYRCHCLVSVLPICIGIICSLARSVLDLSLDTYLYHCSQLLCTCRVVV